MGLHEPLAKRDQDKSKAPQALEKVSKCHTISHKDIRIMLANHRWSTDLVTWHYT
jgi:hypothetical protein